MVAFRLEHRWFTQGTCGKDKAYGQAASVDLSFWTAMSREAHSRRKLLDSCDDGNLWEFFC